MFFVAVLPVLVLKSSNAPGREKLRQLSWKIGDREKFVSLSARSLCCASRRSSGQRISDVRTPQQARVHHLGGQLDFPSRGFVFVLPLLPKDLTEQLRTRGQDEDQISCRCGASEGHPREGVRRNPRECGVRDHFLHHRCRHAQGPAGNA